MIAGPGCAAAEAKEWHPAYRQMYLKAAAQDLGINRWVGTASERIGVTDHGHRLINPNTTVAITEAVVVGCFDDHQQIREFRAEQLHRDRDLSTIFWGSTGAFGHVTGQESAIMASGISL